MTLAATGTWETDSKIQYRHTLFHWKVLHQLYLLCTDVENTDTSLTVDYLSKGFAWYCFPVNSQKKTSNVPLYEKETA